MNFLRDGLIMLSGIVIAVMTAYISRRLKKQLQERTKQQSQIVYTNINNYWKQVKDELINQDDTQYYSELMTNLSKNWQTIYSTYPVSGEKNDDKEIISTKMEELKKRVEEIENRFPKKATLEKIVSVNDAILSTSIENLSDKIKAIETKLLTKWDIVKIVFELLGGLAILIGLFSGSAKLITLLFPK